MNLEITWDNGLWHNDEELGREGAVNSRQVGQERSAAIYEVRSKSRNKSELSLHIGGPGQRLLCFFPEHDEAIASLAYDGVGRRRGEIACDSHDWQQKGRS